MSVAPQTALDLEIVLAEKLELKPKELEHYFDFEEKDGKLVITVHRDTRGKAVWLDRSLWIAVNNYVKGLGGTWDPRSSKWEMDVPRREAPQPKEPSVEAEVPKEVEKLAEPQVSTKVEISDEYDLKLSREKLGALVPILTDAFGNIIDGFHRERTDPNWPRVKIEHITDSVQLSMARLASNVCRREVPAEEKTKLLANIAELTGWDAKEISEALGMSYQWVMKYLPSEFKEKTWQRETAEPIPQRRIEHESVKTEHSEQPIPSKTSEEPFESKSITPTIPVEKIDTGVIFTCPECGWQGTHIHVKPSGKHKLEEVHEL